MTQLTTINAEESHQQPAGDLFGRFSSISNRLTDRLKETGVPTGLSSNFESLIGGIKNFLPANRDLTITKIVESIMDPSTASSSAIAKTENYLYFDPRSANARGITMPPASAVRSGAAGPPGGMPGAGAGGAPGTAPASGSGGRGSPRRWCSRSAAGAWRSTGTCRSGWGGTRGSARGSAWCTGARSCSTRGSLSRRSCRGLGPRSRSRGGFLGISHRPFPLSEVFVGRLFVFFFELDRVGVVPRCCPRGMKSSQFIVPLLLCACMYETVSRNPLYKSLPRFR